MRQVILISALLLGWLALSCPPAPGQDDEAVKQTLKKFTQAERDIAWAESAALAKQGAKAVPLLIEVIKRSGGNDNVLSCAVAALKKMGPEAKPALPMLVSVLKKLRPPPPEAGFMPQQAYPLLVDTLGQFGADAKEALPLLIKHLDAKNAYVVHVIVAVGRMGPEAKDAVPRLTDLAKTGSPAVRMHAQESLEKIKKG
jgi:HEAT repeat protein